MNIAVGCDHRGLKLKQFVMKVITEAGHNYQDFGCYTSESVDYPDIARKVSGAVARGEYNRGILICGTGIGMCVTANKVKGIRAALAYDRPSACQARQHIDANILCLSESQPNDMVRDMVSSFLSCEFEGGRHQRRLDKIKAMEK